MTKEFVIENDKGGQVPLKQIRTSKRKHRVRTEADYQAFLASLGSWKDVDVEQFLKNNEESREMSSRPPVSFDI